MPKIAVKITIPKDLDEPSVHQQLVYALQDYLEASTDDFEQYQIEVNGVIWD